MPSSTNVFIRPFLASAVAVACILTASSIQAADTASGAAMTTGSMAEQCKSLQAHKQQMLAETKAQDAALSEQVAQMNSAADDKKLGLLAALVTRMAEQRIARNAHMATMSDDMMKHMVKHMQAGKESMQECPMMSGTGMIDMKATGTNGLKGTDSTTGEPVKVQK